MERVVTLLICGSIAFAAFIAHHGPNGWLDDASHSEGAEEGGVVHDHDGVINP